MGLIDFDEVRWRYKVESLADVQIENQLNFLGAQGWELVSVVFHPDKEHPYLCFLKQKATG
jgi:hypothetical protein